MSEPQIHVDSFLGFRIKSTGELAHKENKPPRMNEEAWNQSLRAVLRRETA